MRVFVSPFPLKEREEAGKKILGWGEYTDAIAENNRCP
jgi:hypothetical protein